MDQILVPETPIDNAIVAVRPEIEALRHRRSLLSHTLLSSRTLKRQLKRAGSWQPSAQVDVQKITALAQDHEETTTSNLHRTCSGITAFRVQDPDPNAVDNGKVLGIRLEIFSRERRAFQTPYYLLLNQPKSGGRLKVHKHTIPAFVPLRVLMTKYLPFKDDDEMSEKATQQNLPRFVRALRKELIAHQRRTEACDVLKRDVGARHGVEGIKISDETCQEIEVKFEGNVTARIRVAVDGRIERVAVGPPSTNTDDSSDRDMKQIRELKKVIEGGDGRIEGLAGRLRRRRRS